MARSARRTLATPLFAGAILLAGCAGQRSETTADAPPVDNSLASLAGDAPPAPANSSTPGDPAAPDLEAYTSAVTQDLDRILAARSGALNATDTPAPATDDARSDAWLHALSTDAGAALWNATQRHLATMRDGFIEPAWEGMVAEHDRLTESPQVRVARHAEEIAAILRTDLDGSDMPPSLLLTLAAMEAVRPGTLEESVDPLELEMLPPDQRAALEAVRRIVGPTAETDLADRVLQAADAVRDARPMTIRFATLARQVLGYGRYEPFESASFVAGRPQRMIVYTEVDDFAHRPYRQGDAGSDAYGARWTVELSQELQLYRDGAYVWGRREQAIVETSRNRRHDFFLVHDIELPATLAVGPYELKIIMRDKTSGDVDEWIVPFRYVADATAAARAE